MTEEPQATEEKEKKLEAGYHILRAVRVDDMEKKVRGLMESGQQIGFVGGPSITFPGGGPMLVIQAIMVMSNVSGAILTPAQQALLQSLKGKMN